MSPVDIQTQRVNAALRNLFVADALAMPVHWYYNLLDIERAFPGGVSQLEAAPAHHPSSIMSLHSTQGGGRRGSTQNTPREVVGDVILKGRRQFWGQPGYHYHHGMQAGENTLNAQCARLLMRQLMSENTYRADHWLAAYIGFMTADPPLHRDTYAESYHRGFFANLLRGLPPDKCAAVTHDTPSVGGLVSIGPLYLGLRRRDINAEQATARCVSHLHLSHPDAGLARICQQFTLLMELLLNRDMTTDASALLAQFSKQVAGVDVQRLLNSVRDDREIIGGRYSSACYIDGAWPGILYLLYKYHSDPAAGLLANTNLGGDNVHRGAVLGVLLGLTTAQAIEHWFDALVEHQAIAQEIDGLVNPAV